LTDPRAAQQSAREFLTKEQRLDILVNNAARGTGPFKLTKDGLLDIMVINHVSPVAFTDVLLPLMKTTANESGSDVRIVNVASMLHAQVKPTTFATKEAFNKDYGTSWTSVLNTYGNSKLATVLYTKALQTRLSAESVPITCVTLHPGAINTSGAAKIMGGFPLLGWFIKNYVLSLALGTWRSGAMTVAFAGAGKEVATEREKYRGAYLVPVGKIAAPSSYALDVRLQTEVYESTEKFIKEMV